MSLVLIQDFHIKNILNKKNVVADAVLRYSKPKEQTLLEELEEDLDKFIKYIISNIEILKPRNNKRILLLEYLIQLEQYPQFQVNFKVLKQIEPKDLHVQKKQALNFFIKDRLSF